MLTYGATATINVSPEKIWSILTDASGYTEWDTNMIKLEGRIAPGEKLSILTHLAPDRAFTPVVSIFEPHRKMVWSSGMPLGLFKGERTFTLTPKGDSTDVNVKEEFGGLLLPLFKGSIPDMDEVFKQFVAGLKHRAESA